MSILSLRTLFAELTRSLPNSRQKFGPQRRRRRLTQAAQPDAVQSLESRILPATITVTSLDDGMLANGFVTLREAIQAANTNKSVDGSVAGSVGEDTIVFSPSLDTSNGLIASLSMAGEQFTITESLKIIGNGSLQTVIDASSSVTASTIVATAGSLSAATVTPATLVPGDTGTATAAFTTEIGRAHV